MWEAFLWTLDPERDFAQTWPDFVLGFVVPAIKEDSLGDDRRPAFDAWRAFYDEKQYLSPAYQVAAGALANRIINDLCYFARNRKNRTRLYAAMLKAIKEAPPCPRP